MMPPEKKEQKVIKTFFEKKENQEFSAKIEKLIEQNLNETSIGREGSLNALVTRFQFESIPEESTDSDDFIGELSTAIVPNSINTGSPYFIGHMTSLLPNFIRPIAKFAATLNQNMVKVETSKVVTLYERKTLAMLHQLVYEKSEEFYEAHVQSFKSTLGIVTSGGTIANITALQCARNLALKKYGIDVEKYGLSCGMFNSEVKKQVVLCSKFAHYSIKKAMGLLGMGTANILVVATDKDNKLCISDLKNKFEFCRQEHIIVTALIGVAGSTECGAIDPLDEMANLAERHKVYFHVDAAWGGAVQFSSKYKNLLKGIERADSVTLDGHKQLYLPMGIGMLLFKDPKTAGIIEKHSEYIIRKDSFDLGKRSIEGSRPAKVFYLQAALQLLGRKGYEELIDYGIELAKKMQNILEEFAEFELLTVPETNILLYRYIPIEYRYLEKLGTDENSAISSFNIELQKKQFEKGSSFVSRTALAIPKYGSLQLCALRVVLANPLITENHIVEILNEQLDLAKIIETT